jgi:predicted component of type VI protein secretion system
MFKQAIAAVATLGEDMARLILRFKEKVLDSFPLASDQGATIGRHHSNRIVIENLAVSGQHARIDYQDEIASITDLKSKNGTFVNDERVSETRLQHNDVIVVGKHTLLVDLHDTVGLAEVEGVPSSAASTPSPMSEAKTMFLDTHQGRQMRGEEPPPPPPPEPDYAEQDNLLFLAGGEGEVSLARQQVTIGSHAGADIVIGGVRGMMVGSPAAIITQRAGDHFLRFSGGLIKPKRNGSSVKGTIKLNHDDILEIGPVRLRVRLRKRELAD